MRVWAQLRLAAAKTAVVAAGAVRRLLGLHWTAAEHEVLDVVRWKRRALELDDGALGQARRVCSRRNLRFRPLVKNLNYLSQHA